MFSSLTQSCITNIFNYAAATPDDSRDILLLTSKQSRIDCLHESIMSKIVPTMSLSSGPILDSTMTTRTILQKLKNRQFLMGNKKGRSHYVRIEVSGAEVFGTIKLSEAVAITRNIVSRELYRWICLLSVRFIRTNDLSRR